MPEPLYREQIIRCGKEGLVYIAGNANEWDSQKKRVVTVGLVAAEVVATGAWMYQVVTHDVSNIPLLAVEGIAMNDLGARATRHLLIDERFIGLLGSGREITHYLWDLFRPRKTENQF